MKKNLAFILFFTIHNSAYLQSPTKALLSIIQKWEEYKCINLSFNYTSVDANNDTFSLQNEGSLLFSHYRCNAYYQIAGLNLKVNFNNKFIKNKPYEVKSNMEYTLFYDLENSNATTYWKINNQLVLTYFKINQLIPPLLLNDSSMLYNKRFINKLLSNYDSLLTNIKYDSNFQKDFIKFEISFKNIDKNQKFIIWEKAFNRGFIEEFIKKKFIIVIDKKTHFPNQYHIIENDTIFETYSNIKISLKPKYDKKLFSIFPIIPLPKMVVRYDFDVNGRIQGPCTDLKSHNYAFDFNEKDYVTNKQINLYNINSEYILLYFWNSLNYDTTYDFKELCNIAIKYPDKLSIIGLNNYDESKEYIEKVCKLNNWNFPMIKGREIAKRYYISTTPTYVLIKKTYNYCISNRYIIEKPNSILYDVNKLIND